MLGILNHECRMVGADITTELHMAADPSTNWFNGRFVLIIFNSYLIANDNSNQILKGHFKQQNLVGFLSAICSISFTKRTVLIIV